jgi:predicted dinucleotide-utilizing enzyme
LVVITHASYLSPEFTVTFGKVATNSIIPALESISVDETKEVKLDGLKVSVSSNLTLDASPLFTVTNAITSPLVSSTPNIVKMTLNMSVPLPVSADITLTCDTTIVRRIIAAEITKDFGIVSLSIHPIDYSSL